jgi:hypothetical protein
MKKSLMQILSWINEWKFGIFLFLNTIVFVYIFYADINKRKGIGTREIIGDVTFKYNKIQRKFDNEVVWEDLDSNSPLSNRDSVRSDKSSQATLMLKDGTEIQMDEDTMLILEISEKVQKINFTKGSINVKKTQIKESLSASILVESSSGSVKVKDGDVIVAKQNPKALDVAVARGEAEVNIDGEIVNLKKNQVLSFNEKGIETKDSKVKLVSTLEKAKLIESKKEEKYFKAVGATNPITENPNAASNTTQTSPSTTSNQIPQIKNAPSSDPSSPKTAPAETDEDAARRKKEKEAFDRFMKM